MEFEVDLWGGGCEKREGFVGRVVVEFGAEERVRFLEVVEDFVQCRGL